MTLADAPTLPAFIAERMPFARRMLTLRSGFDAGRALHLVDHGAPTGRPVLMVHGNPTWSFLWREVIAGLDPGRFRAVAPDLLGFGLSDRLPAERDHTIERHLDSLCGLVDALDLRDAIVVGQDWGGPLAVGLGARRPDRVSGVVLGNTAVIMMEKWKGTAFHRFARLPVLPELVFRGLAFPTWGMPFVQGRWTSLDPMVLAAYVWPFRHLRDRIAPLALARMVPDSVDHRSVPPLRVGEQWMRGFGGPVALVWGESDPILGRLLGRHVRALPGARVTRTAAGHFLQEEVPEAFVDAIEWVADGGDG